MEFPKIFGISGSGRGSRIVYSKTSTGADCESEEHLLGGTPIPAPVSPISNAWIYLSIVNLTILGITLFLITKSPWHLLGGKNSSLRPISYWSPILDDIEIPTFTTKLNGTVFARPEPSFARGEPSEENDAAWKQFERILTHVVTREEIVKLGKDPETVVRFDDDYWGFGDDAYMVQMDIFHQIHCLNLLRKAAFADYPGYSGGDEPRDQMRWIHLSHCTDMLLQGIQCNSNTEVLTLAWMEGRAAPWPDFSINRKCRSFDTLLQWNRETAVDADKFDAMQMPEDAFVWTAPWIHRDSELGEKLGPQLQD